MDRYIKKYEYKQSIKPVPKPKHLLEMYLRPFSTY